MFTVIFELVILVIVVMLHAIVKTYNDKTNRDKKRHNNQIKRNNRYR